MSGIYSTSAKADEVADLRANQELLQRRIDQLAQAQNVGSGSYLGGAPNPAAGQPAGAGSFPRSFLIPGTDTSLRVGGQLSTSAIYYFTGAPINGAPQSTTVGITGNLESIPLVGMAVVLPNAAGNSAAPPCSARQRRAIIDRSRSNGNPTSRVSRSWETRTPTAWGEARTFIEFDFAGSTNFSPNGAALGTSDSLVPRLRYAYGTLGGLRVGQANSNFSDPDADTEALDFGNNPGQPGPSRIPQIRYTQPLAAWNIPGAVSVSIESPFPASNTPAGSIGSDQTSTTLNTGNSLPGALGGVCTGVATVAQRTGVHHGVWRTDQGLDADLYCGVLHPAALRSHLDFSFVARPNLEISRRPLHQVYLGYGAHVGADDKPGWFGWTDDIQMHVVIGSGIGHLDNGAAYDRDRLPRQRSGYLRGTRDKRNACDRGDNRRRRGALQRSHRAKSLGRQRHCQDGPGGWCQHRLPALVAAEPAPERLDRLGPPGCPKQPDRCDTGKCREQGPQHRPYQPDLEPGILRRHGYRVHLGPSRDGEQPAWRRARAGQQVRRQVLS
jgi:hypothetical protein